MTIVHITPIATMAAIDVCRIMLLMLFSVRKLGVGQRQRDPQRDGEGDDIGLDRQAPKQSLHRSDILRDQETRPERGRRKSCSVIGTPSIENVRPGRLAARPVGERLSCRGTGRACAWTRQADRRASDRPCWPSSPCRRRCRRSSAAARRARRHSRTRPRQSPSCRDPG